LSSAASLDEDFLFLQSYQTKATASPTTTRAAKVTPTYMTARSAGSMPGLLVGAAEGGVLATEDAAEATTGAAKVMEPCCE